MFRFFCTGLSNCGAAGSWPNRYDFPGAKGMLDALSLTGMLEAWDRYDMDEEEEDEEDEEIESGGEELEEGEEDAMYARRMNFTGDWIVNHSRSNSNSAGNLSLLYGDYGMVETHMTTDKEYGKYPLKYVIVLYQKVLLSVFRSLPTGPAQDAGATEIIHLFHA